MSDGKTDGTKGDHPTPIFSSRRAGLASDVLAFLDERAPAEFVPSQIARAIGRASRSVSKALLRLESQRLVVRGDARGAWAGRVSPDVLVQSEVVVPSLHAIQVGLPRLRLRGGLSLTRHPMKGGRRLTLQDGLASVHATFDPVPVDAWQAFIDELGAVLAGQGVELDLSEAKLVSIELNADYRTWRLRGLESVRLQDAPGFWGQLYNKEMADGSHVMRAEIRATPKDVTLAAAGAALVKMRGLGILDAVLLLRRLVA